MKLLWALCLWSFSLIGAAQDLRLGFGTHKPPYVFEGEARLVAGKKIAETFRTNRPDATADQIEYERKRLARAPLRSEPGSAWHYSVATDVLGHLVERLAASQVKATSCSLYAPACTVAFANEKYLKTGAPVIQPRQLYEPQRQANWRSSLSSVAA